VSDKDTASAAAQAANDINPADFMEAGAGYEGMGAAQFSPMYLRILHSDAPQLQEGDQAFVPGAKFGDFFNDLTGKAYGPSIDVIPLKSDVLWMEFKPDLGGFQGAHAPFSIPVLGDEYKGMVVAGGDNAGNQIVPYHVFYVLVVDPVTGKVETPVNIGILSFKSTGIPHAKTWNTRIRQTLLPNGAQAPYYSSVWRLTTAKNQKQAGSKTLYWYTIGEGKTTYAERLRFIDAETYMNAAKPFRAQVDSDKGAMQAAIAQGEAQRQITAGDAETEF
jgi:hypothetical protein